MQSLTIEKLLDCSDSLSWTSSLYLPVNASSLSESTPCVILEETEDEDSAEAADYIAQNDFKYALGIQAVQDIIANAKLQKNDVETSELLRALIYYLRNDAFLSIETTEHRDH